MDAKNELKLQVAQDDAATSGVLTPTSRVFVDDGVVVFRARKTLLDPPCDWLVARSKGAGRFFFDPCCTRLGHVAPEPPSLIPLNCRHACRCMAHTGVASRLGTGSVEAYTEERMPVTDALRELERSSRGAARWWRVRRWRMRRRQ